MTTNHTHPSTTAAKALRAVLVVLGAVSAFVAINVAFGGLETLGLQGPTEHFEVTDHDAYLLRDSHARFYGGVYLGVAAFLILAATNLGKYRTALNVVFGLIFLGGVARLTQAEPGVTFGKNLGLSTVVELVGMPVLAAWLAHATRPARNDDALATKAVARRLLERTS
jgi:Domain of unknown function (DUF4345)